MTAAPPPDPSPAADEPKIPVRTRALVAWALCIQPGLLLWVLWWVSGQLEGWIGHERAMTLAAGLLGPLLLLGLGLAVALSLFINLVEVSFPLRLLGIALNLSFPLYLLLLTFL